MFLMDVNVLVYAHREDTPDHLAYREWLESIINGNATFGYSELVLSGFLRVVTHPRVFEMPSTLSSALGFAKSNQACATGGLYCAWSNALENFHALLGTIRHERE